jgi:hypothetical protein
MEISERNLRKKEKWSKWFTLFFERIFFDVAWLFFASLSFAVSAPISPSVISVIVTVAIMITTVSVARRTRSV